ncbi:MAG: hypothetical protein LBM75_08860 [Myxococcales bacterium]|jgi:hypothetical protein|nr:hypothetical protein [Myxococcales bacterium]
MEETDPLNWSEVNRIIQSLPCSDGLLQRLADCAQLDADANVLELANSLSFSAQCWVSMFGSAVEVVSVESFFASSGAADVLTTASRAAGGQRYDGVLWSLTEPLVAASLESACQKIREALNVDGCLMLSVPVRLGSKPSTEVGAFYAEFGAQPMLPQEVVCSLEQSGFEPLRIEAPPSRPILARYRMIESALERCASVDESTKNRWKREIKLFLNEGGTTFSPSTVFLARRWEYVDES